MNIQQNINIPQRRRLKPAPIIVGKDIDLYLGDCLKILRRLEANSFSACVTDPPYGLNFMGKEWDRLGDKSANFNNLDRPHESQQQFPMRYSRGRPISETDGPAQQRWHEAWAREVYRSLKPGAYLLAFGGTRTYHRLVCAIEDAGFEIRDTIMWLYGSGFPKSHDVSKALDRAAGLEREVVGPPPYSRGRANGSYSETRRVSYDYEPQPITAPATDAAREWAGWGTALKPACEPIVVARKPLSEPTVAANVLRHGTGALNIDASRVGLMTNAEVRRSGMSTKPDGYGLKPISWLVEGREPQGRWPANVCHDGSDEVMEEFTRFGNDTGAAARFFYTAKASKDERKNAKHPTIKPLKLMEWLVGLVSPPDGLVLDPFMGSGTTILACKRLGLPCVGIDKDKDSFDDAISRLEKVHVYRRLV